MEVKFGLLRFLYFWRLQCNVELFFLFTTDTIFSLILIICVYEIKGSKFIKSKSLKMLLLVHFKTVQIMCEIKLKLQPESIQMFSKII